MWIQREIEESILSLAGTRPAVILTGARQTGKTSLLNRCFPDVEYVSMDVPMVAEEAEHSGRDFLRKHPPPVILDEVQHAPAILPYVKADIDAHREQVGRFLISGSQRFPLMEGVTESLAGRAAVMELHSLSARELERHHGQRADRRMLLEWMFSGGFPELHLKGLDPVRYHSDYVATYIERDVRSIVQVRNLRDFDRFLRLCATRTAQQLNLSRLASDVGVTPGTIKSWVSVLQASGIIHLLEPYYENLGRRIVKTPKLYFLDTGLVCYLTGMRTPGDLEHSPILGPVFETHVLGQMIRHHANRGLAPQIYFYRDRLGHEVDFIIPLGGRFHLVECKWSERPSPHQRGFGEIRQLVGPARILSETIVTPERGRRKTKTGVEVADSIEMPFLDPLHAG